MNKTCFFRFLFLFMLIGSAVQAQLSVKSFRMLENDLDARVNFPENDQNGDIAALIKVVTIQKGFTFDGGMTGIVKTIEKPSEIWVYVPWGIKRISIFHPQLGQLRDYMISMSIEKATVYEMVLISGKVTTIVEETIESQWLVITPEPADALIYLDDEFVKTGEYMAKLKPGAYNYRVEMPLYHTEAGKIEVGNEKKTVAVKLKPAFGYIKISSQPEIGAKIFVNGKLTKGTTPLTTEPIASGEHTVQVVKEMYQPITQKVQVSDGQTTSLNVILQPNFAELTINAPAGANIILNNQQKGTGSWSGRLSAGVYSIEARLDKHRTAKQDIELATGDKRTVELQPMPIYGSLDVVSSPSGATIKIDGKDYGTTPNTINRLLIGDYKVELSRQGYAPVSKTISITEGTSAMISETLVNGREVTINSTPSEANLYIDGNVVGKTPYKGYLTFGSYVFKIEIDGNFEEKKIAIDSLHNGEIKLLIPSKVPPEDEVIFIVVESMPSFPGGDAALFKYLSDNIKYPLKAQENGIQGRVICQFVVNADGSIVDIEVVRSVDKDIDAEAVRVISKMPVWIPGKSRGKTVRVKYTLPVNFRLQ